MQERIESVGIDIGTSTTQLIFSQLVIENRAGDYAVPKIEIVSKTVTYRSNIYTTPLLSETRINGDEIMAIIKKEYAAAGKKPSDIQTGAVIITGETARKENANIMLSALSEMAGEFVVATAGPDLESVLSARGAGTDEISQEKHKVVANLDIGGGTTNIAVFDKGTLKSVCCLDVGGRLVKCSDGKITYIFPKLLTLAQAHNLSLQVGDTAREDVLYQLCQIMADQLAQALHLLPQTPEHLNLYTNDGRPLPAEPAIQAVTFSGGVADFVYQPQRDAPFRFHDIGILLGQAIAEHPAFRTLQIYRARETIRATVIGAGNHTTEISGSTISYRTDNLPIKNIPVVRIEADLEGTGAGIIQSLQAQLPMYLDKQAPTPVAISLSGAQWRSFLQMQELADSILAGAKPILDTSCPLIVLVERDIGKSLGNALTSRLGTQRELICLDGVSARSGDYIDVGIPVANGRVIPVVIKTLILNS